MPLLRPDKVQRPVKKRTLTIKSTSIRHVNLLTTKHLQEGLNRLNYRGLSSGRKSDRQPTNHNITIDRQKKVLRLKRSVGENLTVKPTNEGSIYHQSTKDGLNEWGRAFTFYWMIIDVMLSVYFTSQTIL